MTKNKILAVVTKYRRQFEQKNIPKIMMNPNRTLGSLSSEERLAHAHYLLDGIEEFAANSSMQGKTGRYLASVQMILSFENWYTVEELKNHNRPTADD